jgi:hypothetical protein
MATVSVATAMPTRIETAQERELLVLYRELDETRKAHVWISIVAQAKANLRDNLGVMG